MVALLTLEQAKRNLRVFHDDEDLDILDKIKQASEIVVDYLQRPDLSWSDAHDNTESDAPFLIQAAVLLVLTGLWEHRGDEEQEYGQADGYLSKRVTSLLHRTAKLSYA